MRDRLSRAKAAPAAAPEQAQRVTGGSAGAILALQRRGGNRAALAALGGVQRKVDKYAGTEADMGPIADIEDAALDAPAQETLDNVKAGKAPEAQDWGVERTKNNGGKVPKSVKSFKWGVVHHNGDGHLPGKKGAGGYKEYYIRSGTALTDGASADDRLVISNSTGDVFHTGTHYGDRGAPAFTHAK